MGEQAEIEQGQIEKAMNEERWADAQGLINEILSKRPDDHWMLTQLSVTHYEQGEYAAAVDAIERAYAVMPDCPLVLWHRAGAFKGVGRTDEAIEIWKSLVEASHNAEDECYEDEGWFRSLQSDCLYHLSEIYEGIDPQLAADYWVRFRENCERGVPSIYLPTQVSLPELKKRVAELRSEYRKISADIIREVRNGTRNFLVSYNSKITEFLRKQEKVNESLRASQSLLDLLNLQLDRPYERILKSIKADSQAVSTFQATAATADSFQEAMNEVAKKIEEQKADLAYREEVKRAAEGAIARQEALRRQRKGET